MSPETCAADPIGCCLVKGSGSAQSGNHGIQRRTHSLGDMPQLDYVEPAVTSLVLANK
jgi:hypothetical protein